jgi:1-acyl-sn-glycerol-3-phosphate acyltransferase
MIFPEGGIHRKREFIVGKFAPGAIYVHKRLGAPILPIAVWLSERSWPRRRYVVCFSHPVSIPANLDQDAGAAWLRERVLALYDEIKQREDQ